MQSIIKTIEEAIKDEQQHQDIEYHRGRLSAFQFVLSMLKEHRDSDAELIDYERGSK